MRWSGDDLRSVLDRLDTSTADDLEAETLEFKGRPRDRAQLKSWSVEAAVCLANAKGGTLVLGVKDRVRGRREAIVGVGSQGVAGLRRDIYDSTDPHILVEVEELSLPEGRLIAIHVPRGLPPHTTTAGLALIRIDKACVPLTGTLLSRLLASSGEVDLSAQPLDGVGVADLDQEAVAEGRRLLRGQPRLAELATAGVGELLDGLGLMDDGSVRMAGLLLFGAPAALRRHLPQHEVTLLRYRRSDRYDQRVDLRGPLLIDLARVEAFLDASIEVRTITPSGFAQLELPGLTWEVAREAVLNAVSHRDYFLREGTLISVHGDRVSVASPGGFIGGVTPENVLRHSPVHRNELLARALQQLGLVNRVGLGVDRIYEGLLRLGSVAPSYAADEGSVTLTLPQGGSDEFAAWAADYERTEGRLELDDLLVLRRLVGVGAIDRWAAAQELQLHEQSAAEHLASMRSRRLLVARGRGRTAAYSLPRPLSERLRGQAVTDADRPLEVEGVRLRVLELLRERGRLTNAQIRAFSGYSRQQVLALEKGLQHEGLIEMRGHGRGAHIVLATDAAATG